MGFSVFFATFIRMKKLFVVVLICSKFVLAQTGPAGVSTSTANFLWLKADAGTSSTVDATALSQWQDQSGNNNHVSQSTAVNRPVFEAGITSTLNGMPLVEFDNDNTNYDYFSIADNATLDNFSGFTSFAIFRLKTGTPGGTPRGIFSKRNSPSAQYSYSLFHFTSNRMNLDVNGTGNRLQSATSFIESTDHLVVASFNSTLTTNEQKIYVGNTQDAQNNNTAATVANTTSSLHIGVLYGHTGANVQFNGYIGEIVLYNRILNDAERIIVANYLSAKYNVGLSSSDVYFGDNGGNGDYDKEVAGVGSSTNGVSPSFSASTCGGLGISTTGTGLDVGDYILAGHATNTNSQVTTDVGGMTGTNNARWHRIWYVDITNTSTNIQTNIEFDMSDGDVGVVALSTPTNYVLLYRAAQTGNWTELATANAIIGDGVQFSSYSFVNDGYYTIGTKDYLVSPLPIELLSFNAIQNKDIVNIFWETASETNNDYYTVERSKDGIAFEPVSITKGSSKSLQNLEYAETDFNPLSGISYYRLKQTDLNGEFSYSKIVAVNYHFGDIGMDVYPNPNSGDFKISLTGIENKEVLVVVRDISGKDCFSKIVLTQDQDQIIAVDLSGNLKPGTYIVISSSFNKLYSKKIIVK
jgi:hypothetical protein